MRIFSIFVIFLTLSLVFGCSSPTGGGGGETGGGISGGTDPDVDSDGTSNEADDDPDGSKAKGVVIGTDGTLVAIMPDDDDIAIPGLGMLSTAPVRSVSLEGFTEYAYTGKRIRVFFLKDKVEAVDFEAIWDSLVAISEDALIQEDGSTTAIVQGLIGENVPSPSYALAVIYDATSLDVLITDSGYATYLQTDWVSGTVGLARGVFDEEPLLSVPF